MSIRKTFGSKTSQYAENVKYTSEYFVPDFSLWRRSKSSSNQVRSLYHLSYYHTPRAIRTYEPINCVHNSIVHAQYTYAYPYELCTQYPEFQIGSRIYEEIITIVITNLSLINTSSIRSSRCHQIFFLFIWLEEQGFCTCLTVLWLGLSIKVAECYSLGLEQYYFWAWERFSSNFCTYCLCLG